MADEGTAGLDNARTSQRIQEKFDAYLLGLIFTILGLSIQTAKFGISPYADILELAAWLSLLIAGLAGLSRLEWIPVMYRVMSAADHQRSLQAGAKEAKLKGATEFHVVDTNSVVPVDKYIAEAKAGEEKYMGQLDPMEKRARRKYNTMRWAFVVGLVLLTGARALPQVIRLLTLLR